MSTSPTATDVNFFSSISYVGTTNLIQHTYYYYYYYYICYHIYAGVYNLCYMQFYFAREVCFNSRRCHWKFH
jgi:hypothetical protein